MKKNFYLFINKILPEFLRNNKFTLSDLRPLINKNFKSKK